MSLLRFSCGNEAPTDWGKLSRRVVSRPSLFLLNASNVMVNPSPQRLASTPILLVIAVYHVMFGFTIPIGLNPVTKFPLNTEPITDGQGNRWVRPGDLIYSDLNNDGMIDDWDVNPIAQGNADMEGQSIPEITYGLNMSLAWRNFDMSALFQGATNYSVRLIEQLSAPYPWGRNGLSHFYDSWHQADINDPNSEWIPGEYPAARLSGVNPNNRTSSYFIKDASYLRLKSLEIGYTLPEEVLKKVGVKQCRVFVNGFNLLTWSGLSFMDPEHPQDQYGYMYPITRNLNLGINVSF